VAAGGRVYLSNNDGVTFVIRAGREFQLLSTNNLGERITASPAVSGKDLYYRTDSQVYCLRMTGQP
jgi:outer membrane protein assembly factor BamB